MKDGFVAGKGLADFKAVSWDGRKRDATPQPHSPAIGQADRRFLADVDIRGRKRDRRPTAGAFGAP